MLNKKKSNDCKNRFIYSSYYNCHILCIPIYLDGDFSI